VGVVVIMAGRTILEGGGGAITDLVVMEVDKLKERGLLGEERKGLKTEGLEQRGRGEENAGCIFLFGVASWEGRRGKIVCCCSGR